jgi:CRP-like cAMP-binding protein
MARPDPASLAGTFLGMLGDTERRWLHDRGDNRTYQAGYLITVEGNQATNVTLVLEGLATAVCATGAKATILLRIYGPGDVMGVEAIFNQQVSPQSVQAITECSALVIPAGRFVDLHRSAGVARAFGVAMARRVLDADEQARTRLAPPSVRLARALLELSVRAGVMEEDGILIPVDLSQETLATWIAASRATVARTIAEFREQGMISTGYRKVMILDQPRLGSVARADQRTQPLAEA